MGKKKIFVRTDLTVPTVDLVTGLDGTNVISLASVPPKMTVVDFPAAGNASQTRSFDFARWYGVGIDDITYACQRQIERLLATHDGDVSPASVVTYCRSGVQHFLDYLILRSVAEGCSLSMADINRSVIDGFILSINDGSASAVTQSNRYHATKSVLVWLGKRKLLKVITKGDDATFPRNAFPNSHGERKGESPIPKGQRQAFAAAVKTAVMPIFAPDAQPSSLLLSYAVLIIALHTGRNTVPLLEMDIDCLRSHPKDKLEFLVVYKRRSRANSKVVLGAEKAIDSTPTVFPSVARLIRRAIEITADLRAESNDHKSSMVWLYRSKSGPRQGEVWALSASMVGDAVKKLVKQFDLRDTDGKPLRINISRLRKTFINRINEILDDDLVTTAAAAGNTPKVTGNIYLRPGETSKRNWKFMGLALTKELLTSTLGATEKTPTGGCTDTKNGQYAPRRDGATCMNFLDCIRCRNYVVTGEDLYRLFSFYWRVYKERERMDVKKWDRQYAHIVRLIERDVIDAGLVQKAFIKSEVDDARARARTDPHPFWAAEDSLGAIR